MLECILLLYAHTHLEVGSSSWNKSISVNKEEKRMGICQSLMSWSPLDAVALLININK